MLYRIEARCSVLVEVMGDQDEIEAALDDAAENESDLDDLVVAHVSIDASPEPDGDPDQSQGRFRVLDGLLRRMED